MKVRGNWKLEIGACLPNGGHHAHWALILSQASSPLF